MGVLSKIGKVLLTAAPYIAAPFTGGASLAATGLANKAVQKWSESDAKKRMAKGLAPSNFDKILGKVGGYAGLATSIMPTGALGNLGLLGKAGSLANTGSKIAKAGSITSKVLGGINRATGDRSSAGTAYGGTPPYFPTSGQNKGFDWEGMSGSIGSILGRMGQGSSTGRREPTGAMGGGNTGRTQQGGQIYRGRMGRALGPSMNMMDQSNPNLAMSIAQGRAEAMQNQPWRFNPTVTAPPEEEGGEPIVTQLPRVFPTIGRRGIGPRMRSQAAY